MEEEKRKQAAGGCGVWYRIVWQVSGDFEKISSNKHLQ